MALWEEENITAAKALLTFCALHYLGKGTIGPVTATAVRRGAAKSIVHPVPDINIR